MKGLERGILLDWSEVKGGPLSQAIIYRMPGFMYLEKGFIQC